MNMCEKCSVSSPSGCAKISNESCLKESLEMLSPNTTRGDIMKMLFGLTLDDFKHTWGGGDVTDEWWNTPFREDKRVDI